MPFYVNTSIVRKPSILRYALEYIQRHLTRTVSLPPLLITIMIYNDVDETVLTKFGEQVNCCFCVHVTGVELNEFIRTNVSNAIQLNIVSCTYNNHCANNSNDVNNSIERLASKYCIPTSV